MYVQSFLGIGLFPLARPMHTLDGWVGNVLISNLNTTTSTFFGALFSDFNVTIAPW
jgi:hypothetical protein